MKQIQHGGASSISTSCSCGLIRRRSRMTMYFDDCERLGIEEWDATSSSTSRDWIVSFSEEKRLAIEKLLGYNPTSASKLTDEQVEEETLRWAVDTNLVGGEDDTEEQEEDTFPRGARYDGIKDLLVASSCNTTLESLVFMWSAIADALEKHQSQQDNKHSSSSSSSVQLIVFPKSAPLWDYDVMVSMLQAVQISKPFLPAEYNLQLDLFHPNYKHSPRMWSPEMHSPFPTVGISITEKKQPSVEEIDVDATRAKLDALFQSMDANREYIQKRTDADEDHAQILQECLSWLSSERAQKHKSTKEASKNNNNDNNSIGLEWTIQTHEGPFQLYRTLWNTILTLPTDQDTASVVVAPSLDSHTLHRVAVTVNAALIRLDIPVRITQVYTPYKDGGRRSPYGMIQLSPIRTS